MQHISEEVAAEILGGIANCPVSGESDPKHSKGKEKVVLKPKRLRKKKTKTGQCSRVPFIVDSSLEDSVESRPSSSALQEFFLSGEAARRRARGIIVHPDDHPQDPEEAQRAALEEDGGPEGQEARPLHAGSAEGEEAQALEVINRRSHHQEQEASLNEGKDVRAQMQEEEYEGCGVHEAVEDTGQDEVRVSDKAEEEPAILTFVEEDKAAEAPGQAEGGSVMLDEAREGSEFSRLPEILPLPPNLNSPTSKQRPDLPIQERNTPREATESEKGTIGQPIEIDSPSGSEKHKQITEHASQPNIMTETSVQTLPQSGASSDPQSRQDHETRDSDRPASNDDFLEQIMDQNPVSSDILKELEQNYKDSPPSTPQLHGPCEHRDRPICLSGHFSAQFKDCRKKLPWRQYIASLANDIGDVRLPLVLTEPILEMFLHYCEHSIQIREKIAVNFPSNWSSSHIDDRKRLAKDNDAYIVFSGGNNQWYVPGATLFEFQRGNY